jgi:hypothetical protein
MLIKKYFRLYYIAICYLLISLLVGEFNPFTRVPMYNSFPNYAYTFYITDAYGKNLCATNEHLNSGNLSHIYCSIVSKYNLFYGFRKETKQEMNLVAGEMFNNFKNDSKVKLPKGLIFLRRISFSIENEKLCKQNDLIYTFKNS